MNSNEHYNSLPLQERKSGNFSEQSIRAHQDILKREFYVAFKYRAKTVLINSALSFCVFAGLVLAVTYSHQIPGILNWFLDLESTTCG